MKKVINVGIGGRAFVLDEDAYLRLSTYLDHFRSRLSVPESQKKEVMDELEGRIADLLKSELDHLLNGMYKLTDAVVNIEMVNKVAARLGMPDGSVEENMDGAAGNGYSAEVKHQMYRDPDNKAIGGVCSGLAAYFNVDVVPIRLIFVLMTCAGTCGLWVYIAFWLIAPKAVTPAQKCELRGIPATAENMAKFKYNK